MKMQVESDMLGKHTYIQASTNLTQQIIKLHALTVSAWERSCLTYECIKQSGTECTYCDSQNSQVYCRACSETGGTR
jgi:hypothetical protein